MILRQTRETVNAAAGKVMAAAADTRQAIVAVGLLAVVALGLALVGVVLAVRAGRA